MQTQKNTTKEITWYELTAQDVRQGLYLVLSNPKKVDKYGLSSFLRMLDCYRYMYCEYWKRNEILTQLIQELSDDHKEMKLAKLTHSAWIQREIVTNINKVKKHNQ